jgi:hypothetical protein
MRLLSRRSTGAFEDATTAKARLRATAGGTGVWGAIGYPFLEKPEAFKLNAISRQ